MPWSEPELTPIESTGFFTVYPHGEILQVVEYKYYEETGYYQRVLEDKGLLAREKRLLHRGMENILRGERILINGQQASWNVLQPDIVLLEPNRPVIIFHVSISFNVKDGRNIYEEYYEEAEAEYNYEAYWYLPMCMHVLKVEASGETGVSDDDRLVVIKVSKGEHVEGYESLLFENKCKLSSNSA
ncbi:MAG: hypothetical protein F7B60_03770 [Desulfurococcales archaeon]|nr:hypothetical protein [Desulfurococcales archaeon]